MEPGLHDIEELGGETQGSDSEFVNVPTTNLEEDVLSTLPLLVHSDLIKFNVADLRAYTNEFDGCNLLGRGAYGSVYKGRIEGRADHGLHGVDIAVKASRGLFAADKIQWENEIRYLPLFSHDNMINLIGIAETTKSLYLIYPLMENGNVRRNLRELDWSKTLKIIRGIALALRELHHHVPPLIFRDLKLENILLDRDFNPKLADWGTVTEEGEFSPHYTTGYMLPNEIYEPGHSKLDIYSMGVCILQLLMKNGQVTRPYDPDPRFPCGSLIRNWAQEEYSKSRHIVHTDLQRSGSKGAVAKAISRLGLDCVKDNRDDRPSVNEVLAALSQLEICFMKKLVKNLTIPCMKN